MIVDWSWTWAKLPLSVLFLVCVSVLLSLQNKLKKIKEKYKDQDEEDRELRMQLLGVRRLSLCIASSHLESFQSHLSLIGMLTLWMLCFFSQLEPPRKIKIRGRKERRGRGKMNPSGNRPHRNHLRNLVTWRRQRRSQSRQKERRILRRERLERRQLLLTRRKRCLTQFRFSLRTGFLNIYLHVLV